MVQKSFLSFSFCFVFLSFLNAGWFVALHFFALKFLPNRLGSLPREIRIERWVDKLTISCDPRAFSGTSFSEKGRLVGFQYKVSWTWRKNSWVQAQAPNTTNCLRPWLGLLASSVSVHSSIKLRVTTTVTPSTVSELSEINRKSSVHSK